MAYDYLTERNMTGRTRKKLLGLLTVAHVWNNVQALEPFIKEVVSQDKEAAADSEDARFVEALRDLVIEEAGDQAVLGDADPIEAFEIPYSDVKDRFNTMTGLSDTKNAKTPSWVGHVRKRLGFEKAKCADGTVISDPELIEKLDRLCDEHNLSYTRLEGHRTVEPLPDDDGYRADCSECGELQSITHRNTVGGYHMCADCADEWNDEDPV